MSRFTPKQKYIRMFLMVSIVFVLTFIPFSTFLSHQFSKYANEQIHTNNHEKLNQIVVNLEFYLTKLKSYGISMYEDQTIRDWLMAPSESPLSQNKALISTNNWLSTEPYIKDVYLLNMRTNRAIDARKGLYSFDDFFDRPMLRKVREDRPSFLRYFSHEVNGEDHLSLIIPSTPSHTEQFGYMVVLLDNQLLQRYFLPSYGAGGDGYMFIVDETGRTIMGPKGVGLTNLQEENWYVNQADIKTQSWTVYYLTKSEAMNRNISALQQKLVFSCLLVITVLLLFVFWVSRRTIKPFSRLAQAIRQKMEKEQELHGYQSLPEEEIQVIEQGIQLLSATVDRMSTSLRDHREIVGDEYLRRWVLYGTIQNDVFQNMKLLNYSILHLIVIRIELYRQFSEMYNFQSRKLLKYAFGNIAKETVANRGWVAESIDFGGDHVVLLLGRNETNPEPLFEVLGSMKQNIEQTLKLNIVVGTSDAKGFDADLRILYDHIYELTLLKFIGGEQKIYSELDFEQYLRLVQPNDDQTMLEELIRYVRLGHKDKAMSALHDIFHHMRSLTYSECKFELTLMVYTLMKVFKQFSGRVDSIQEQLERFGSLTEVKDWLTSELDETMKIMGAPKHGTRKEDLFNEVKEYIESRIQHPSLSVDEISDHMSLSVSYIRQVFKEVGDVTLSDFILEQRIQNVKNLLETTDWPVEEIAKRAGFQTKSHFFTAFKKSSGMTPSEYRQLYSIERHRRLF